MNLHRLDVKTIRTTQNSKSDQNTMNCIYLMTKRSKQRKTTKAIELRWIASIWRQNDQKCFVKSQYIQNNSKLQKYSNYDEFASIWSRNDKKYWLTSQTVQNKAKLQNWSKYNELHRFYVKTIKTTQNYKSDQITTNCMDLTSERSKQRKTWKVIKIPWIASIWSENDQNNAKLRELSNYHELHRNNAKLRKSSNYNELHRLDVKTIKNVELRRKTFKQR